MSKGHRDETWKRLWEGDGQELEEQPGQGGQLGIFLFVTNLCFPPCRPTGRELSAGKGEAISSKDEVQLDDPTWKQFLPLSELRYPLSVFLWVTLGIGLLTFACRSYYLSFPKL